MKKINKKSAFLLVISLIISGINPIAQCEEVEKTIDKSFEELGDFKFQKKYEFFVSGDKYDDGNSFTLNISKGVTYKFQMADSKKYEEDLPVLKILHKTGKFIIASSYNKTSNKYYNSVEFKCMSTASVLVSFNFSKYSNGCGVCVMGMKTE